MRTLSMPYWCVANPVGDPFGGGVLPKVSVFEVTECLLWAKKEGLIVYTSAHDDDLVPWHPEEPEDDLDPSSETYQVLQEVKHQLQEAGISVNTVGCNLHSHPLFRNGGLANPNPAIRLVAIQKAMRTLRIGHFLGARYFTYWVARDGFECQFAVPWESVFSYLREGLDILARYVKEHELSLQGGTIEYKPNEPRGEMFLPTVGHALGFIAQLEEPDFWGVNPEVLQHDQMASLTSILAIAYALSAGKLCFLHVGNQKPNQFDNDNPPLIGMDGVKEFVSILYLLERARWEGIVEFDNHMLRTDAVPQEEAKIEVRKEYIRLAVESYRLAEAKAEQLLQDGEICRLQEMLWRGDERIERVLTSRDVRAIASLRVDVAELNEKRLSIGYLDFLVNKKVFGL